MTTTMIVCAVLIAVGIAVIVVLLRHDKRAPRFVPGGPISAGGPYCFDFDDYSDEAIALLGDDFTEWEKELSTR